jgi:hypothetical protein
VGYAQELAPAGCTAIPLWVDCRHTWRTRHCFRYLCPLDLLERAIVSPDVHAPTSEQVGDNNNLGKVGSLEELQWRQACQLSGIYDTDRSPALSVRNNRVRATNVRTQESSREKTWTKFHDAQNKLMAPAWRLLTCSALIYINNCVRLHSISLDLHSTDQLISPSLSCSTISFLLVPLRPLLMSSTTLLLSPR